MKRLSNVECNRRAKRITHGKVAETVRYPRESSMDITTLLIIAVIVVLLGGGFYGRGRWY